MARAARTFRIFVSSTFADLVAERNALHEHVFPLLHDFCMQHGARFQAIDLRWGVSEEAGLDQQTINICLDEIDRCRTTSPRPNFVVLLGDRYGWQPPPPQIRAQEFEEILGRVTREEEGLLREWYVLDKNAVPPEYYLKPRERGGDLEDPEAWFRLEEQLHSILEKAVEDMPLEHADRLKYVASATEQEIYNGVIRSPEEHVFCFFRSIEGLPGDESAKDYVNLGPNKCRDPVATAKLDGLKGTLKGILPRQNVRDDELHSELEVEKPYKVRWTGPDPQDPNKPPITLDHIPLLCGEVYAALRSVIEDEINQMEEVDPLARETDAHEEFAKDRARLFTGRTGIVDRIGSYIEQRTGSPLVVWGAPGSGKSAVIARAGQLAEERYPGAIVLRFIGVTPESSNVRSLLDSLCRQISDGPRSYPLQFGVAARQLPPQPRVLRPQLLCQPRQPLVRLQRRRQHIPQRRVRIRLRDHASQDRHEAQQTPPQPRNHASRACVSHPPAPRLLHCTWCDPR
jgi:NACHT domain- and WD repeat-containing protein